MRQLWAIGWMHNRVRMLTASFLVKHLLIDWRRGERWFWDTLVDADYGNNSLNWQWIAGTGTDQYDFADGLCAFGCAAQGHLYACFDCFRIAATCEQIGRERAIEESFPESTPRCRFFDAGLHSGSQFARESREHAKTLRKERLQLLSQPASEHRCVAAACDRDHDR